jgi:hypothetical protein
MFEYKHADKINQDLLRAITGLGMGIYRHVPGLNVLAPFAPGAVPDEFLLNVFGCSPARAHSLAALGLLVPEVPTLPPIDVERAQDVVGAWLQRRPWRDRLWTAAEPHKDLPGKDVYLAAVAELIQSEDESLPIGERFGRARRALANLVASMNYDCNISRLLTTARAAMALGERSASVSMLGQVVKVVSRLTDDVASALPEPFMPACSRQDGLSPLGASANQVLAIMADEPYLERCAFSIYFTREKAAPLLRRVASNPLHSEASKRRILTAKRLFPF